VGDTPTDNNTKHEHPKWCYYCYYVTSLLFIMFFYLLKYSTTSGARIDWTLIRG